MKNQILLSSILLFLFSCSHVSENKDILDDQYFEKIVTQFQLSKINFIQFLKTAEPAIYSQIEKDKLDPTVTELWGKSYNFDSGANKTILDIAMIEPLQAEFNIKNDNMIVHAGIMHTYGYLFSTLNTPYGYKRKRWVIPTIDTALNLKKAAVSPHPEEGTLLTNITYIAGKLAFDDQENLLKLDKLMNVSTELKNYNFAQIKKVSIVEEITYPGNVPYNIKTTLIKFLSKLPSEENDYLLIYSTKNRETKVEQLITAFPIKKDAYQKMLDPMLLGDDRPILIKNNGYIGTDKNERLSGKRLILGELY